MTKTDRIAIVGGGPGGLLLARLLQMRGRAVTVFERDQHAEARPQGGSLDLHAGTGQRALRLAGLQAEVEAAARPEDQGDRLYDQHGALLHDRDGAGDDRPEIDRSALRALLLASLVPGTVRWGRRVARIDPGQGGGFDLATGGGTARFDIVVGADGAWSRIRRLLDDLAPVYQGAALLEIGFDAGRHAAVEALMGSGKMFAVGRNRFIIGQRNGHGHIRGYAGLPLPEAEARRLADLPPEPVRRQMREAFAGWAPALLRMIDDGDILGLRPLYALPLGQGWPTRPGVTLLGDAAHLMTPFSGEGVNLALADAADLAEALLSGQGWPAVAAYEAAMMARAIPAAAGADQGLRSVLSDRGAAALLDHFREREAA